MLGNLDYNVHNLLYLKIKSNIIDKIKQQRFDILLKINIQFKEFRDFFNILQDTLIKDKHEKFK